MHELQRLIAVKHEDKKYAKILQNICFDIKKKL